LQASVMSADSKDAKVEKAAATGASTGLAAWPARLRQLFGDTFVNNKSEKFTAKHFEDKVIGVYFSAHWCPPCRGFTPELVKTYNTLKAAGKNIEIVFASSDQDAHQFQDYFHTMPWLSLPFTERKRTAELSSHFKVDGIPSLIFVDGKDGHVITKNGRMSVMMDKEGKEFPWIPQPINELNMTSVSDINESATLIAFVGSLDEWTCAACTVRNTVNQDKCEICESIRTRDPESEKSTKKSGVDPAVATAIISAMRTVATDTANKAKQDNKDMGLRFLYAKNDQIVSKVRQFIGIAASETLVIVDIPRRCKYISDRTPREVTEGTIRDFVTGFQNGTLQRVNLPAPQSQGEEDY